MRQKLDFCFQNTPLSMTSKTRLFFILRYIAIHSCCLIRRVVEQYWLNNLNFLRQNHPLSISIKFYEKHTFLTPNNLFQPNAIGANRCE
jgi:hypothetical protein